RTESRGGIHRCAEEPAFLVQHTARRYADADAKRPGSSQAVLCELALDRLGAADRIRRPEKEGEYAVTSVLDLGPDMIGETTPQDLVVAVHRLERRGIAESIEQFGRPDEVGHQDRDLRGWRGSRGSCTQSR